MQKMCSIGCIWFLLVIGWQQSHAQHGDSPASRTDSIVAICNLIQEQMLYQLHQTTTYKTITQTGLSALLLDSASLGAVSELVLEKLKKAKGCYGKHGKRDAERRNNRNTTTPATTIKAGASSIGNKTQFAAAAVFPETTTCNRPVGQCHHCGAIKPRHM